MDFTPHERTERAVDQLMTRDAAFAGELGGDDPRLEMGLVVRTHQHFGAGQRGPDQFGDFIGMHGLESSWRYDAIP